MKPHRIISLETRDVRFPLHEGAGSDAVHSGSAYAFATTLLASGDGLYGTGIVLTLGQGNQLVCEAIQLLASTAARATSATALAGASQRNHSSRPRFTDQRVLRFVGEGTPHTFVAAAS